MEHTYLQFWLVSLCCNKINSGTTIIVIAKLNAYLQYLKTSPLVVLPDVGGECCCPFCFEGRGTITLGTSHVVAEGRQGM